MNFITFVKTLIFSILVTQNKSDNLWTPKFHPISNTIVYENYTELQISGLEGTLHYETLSHLKNVSKVKIFDNRLTRIEPGAICSSPNIKSVELNFAANSEAPSLTKDVFRQCHLQLQHLFIRLDFDNPSHVDKDALEYLNLRSFGLQCHKIGTLKTGFLTLKTSNLTHLVLSSCYIHTIEPDFFYQMENLEEIEISYNRNLTHLPKNLFVKTSNLKRLFLQYNRIRELTWDEFAGLALLEELDLSGNRLAFFHAEKIAESLPNLKRMRMFKNLWPCKLKEKFKSDLTLKMNRSVEVAYSYGGCKNYLRQL